MQKALRFLGRCAILDAHYIFKGDSKMKKALAIIFAFAFLTTLLVGCGSKAEAPTSETVKQAISSIDGIMEIEIVTEDNDPNDQLGKQGGYVGALFFTYNLVDEDDVYGDTAIERATDGGGCIEIYANTADAKKRNDYLAQFDGGFLASGSHKVLNTMVIRTSSKLKASEQSALEGKLVEALS